MMAQEDLSVGILIKLYQNICFPGVHTEPGDSWQCPRCVIPLNYSLHLLFKELHFSHLHVHDFWFLWRGEGQYKCNVFLQQRRNEQSPGESKLP